MVRKATFRGALPTTQRTLEMKLEVIVVVKEGHWGTALTSEVPSTKVVPS